MLPAAVWAMLVAGFGEETVFRGYLFQWLGKLFGSAVGAKVGIVLLTSAIFALAHYPDQGLAGTEQILTDVQGEGAVNVLGEGMEQLARCFATPAENKFEDIPLVRRHELPVLEWAIAHFVCTLHDCLPGGDHTIFVGEVLDCGHRAGARPLLYFRSGFGEMASADRDAELLSGTWGAYLSAHT